MTIIERRFLTHASIRNCLRYGPLSLEQMLATIPVRRPCPWYHGFAFFVSTRENYNSLYETLVKPHEAKFLFPVIEPYVMNFTVSLLALLGPPQIDFWSTTYGPCFAGGRPRLVQNGIGSRVAVRFVQYVLILWNREQFIMRNWTWVLSFSFIYWQW